MAAAACRTLRRILGRGSASSRSTGARGGGGRSRRTRSVTDPGLRATTSRVPGLLRLAVREDVDDVAGAVPRLHPAPEGGGEDLAVGRHEGAAQALRQAQEGEELLREDVVLAHVEGRLARPGVLVVARRGQVAEVAVGDE